MCEYCAENFAVMGQKYIHEVQESYCKWFIISEFKSLEILLMQFWFFRHFGHNFAYGLLAQL